MAFRGIPWSALFAHHARRVGAALHEKQFRYFLLGSFLSNIGTWMQSIAQSWLVLQLSNSPFYLGLDGFANTVPIAVFAFWGGVVADHFNRRRLLIVTQWTLLVLALLLGISTQFHWIRVWQIILVSFGTGLTQSIAWPVYQAVLGEMVERKNLSNAIALNSAQFNLARSIGPILGAVGLSLFGTAGCFYANAASFLAVIAVLETIQISPKHMPGGLSRVGLLAAMKDGFRYIRGAGALSWMLITMAATSVLGVPMMTLMPVFARDVLKIGAPGLGWLVGSFGAGAVVAGFVVAYRADFPRKGAYVLKSVMVFVIAMIGFALSRWVPLSVLCVFFAGFSMVSFASVVNTIVQASAPDHLRGRAMSLFVFSFGGCMPVGNLLAGWMANRWGAPATLLWQGLALGLYTVALFVARPEVRELA